MKLIFLLLLVTTVVLLSVSADSTTDDNGSLAEQDTRVQRSPQKDRDRSKSPSRNKKKRGPRKNKRRRPIDRAHAFANLRKMGRGEKEPSAADFEEHAKIFCKLFPHSGKCKNGALPTMKDLSYITKRIERRQKKRRIPKVNRKHHLDGIPTDLADRIRNRKTKFGNVNTEQVQKFKGSCRNGKFKCREQPEEAKTRRKLLRDQLLVNQIDKQHVEEEEADDNVELMFDRTLRVKRALLEKANLTNEVDPVDDGVYESDMLLTENQANILLNDLDKAETDGDEDLSPDEDDEDEAAEEGRPPNPGNVPAPPSDIAASTDSAPEETSSDPSADPTPVKRARKKRAGVYVEENFAEKWDTFTPIPYKFDASIAPWDQTDIRDALAEISSRTCIKFQYVANPTGYHINYVKINSPTFCGLSYIGRVSPVNTVYLSFQCGKNKGVVIHETMHALGIIHQHLRMDRDQFLKIDWSNMNPQYYDQFSVADQKVFTSYGVKYDYGSIMHYNAYTSAIDTRKPTLVPLFNSASSLSILGQRDKMAESDVQLINKMYCKAANCVDQNIYCGAWALSGVCTLQGNSVWMAQNCRKSCNLC